MAPRSRSTAASDGRAPGRAGKGQQPKVTVPLLGTVTVPPRSQLAFYAVLGALGVLEIIEWPIVLVVGAGHFLAQQHRAPTLQEAGEAAEAA